MSGGARVIDRGDDVTPMGQSTGKPDLVAPVPLYPWESTNNGCLPAAGGALRTAEAPTNTTSSPINCVAAVVALGYQTTISSERSLCESASVEDWKPTGFSSASAIEVSQVNSRTPKAIFNVVSSLIRQIHGSLNPPSGESTFVRSRS